MQIGCDNCSREVKAYRLPIGGGAGINLCKSCWAKEMKWRKQRNKTLSKDAKFTIKKWPGR